MWCGVWDIRYEMWDMGCGCEVGWGVRYEVWMWGVRCGLGCVVWHEVWGVRYGVRG